MATASPSTQCLSLAALCENWVRRVCLLLINVLVVYLSAPLRWILLHFLLQTQTEPPEGLVLDWTLRVQWRSKNWKSFEIDFSLSENTEFEKLAARVNLSPEFVPPDAKGKRGWNGHKVLLCCISPSPSRNVTDYQQRGTGCFLCVIVLKMEAENWEALGAWILKDKSTLDTIAPPACSEGVSDARCCNKQLHYTLDGAKSYALVLLWSYNQSPLI